MTKAETGSDASSGAPREPMRTAVGHASIAGEGSRTFKFLASLSATYAAQFLTLLASFVLTPFLVRVLGTANVGRWWIVLQLLGYLQLVDFGTATALSRQLGASRSAAPSRSAPSPRELVESAFGVLLWQYALALIACAVAIGGGWLASAERELLIVACGTFLVTFPTKLTREILRAYEDLPFLGGVQLVSMIATLAAQFVLVTAGLGPLGLALGWALGECFSGLSTVVRLVRKYPALIPRTIRARLRNSALRLDEAWWLFVAQIAQLLVAGSDLLVVGALLGPEHAASYSMTNRLFATFATYPQQILLIAMPSLVAIHAESGPLTAMRRLKTLSMLAAWGTMALGAVTIAANPSFVGAWVGADHFAGRFVTMLLPVTAFARILRLSPAVGLVAAGQQRVISIAAVCSGVLSVAAAISLGHWFGMSGVIVGYALGASVIELPANLVNYARVIETPAREWLRAHLPVVLVLLGSWSIAAAISYWITAPRFDHAIVAVMGAGATVLVTSAPLLFLREFRAEMTSRMRQLSERASKYIPRRASGKA